MIDLHPSLPQSENADPEICKVDSGLRFYSPELGRWPSRDPISERGHRKLASDFLFREDFGKRQSLYGFVFNTAPNAWDPDGRKVQICCRDLNVNPVADCLAKFCGVQHCWIRTDTKDAGMGPANNGPLPAYPCCGTKVAVTDHSGDTEKQCYDVPGVNESCVNNKLKVGKDLGDWSSGNQCNSFVGDVLTDCGAKNTCLKWITVCVGWPTTLCHKVCDKWALPPTILPPPSAP
jgi:hypothetical protein